MKSVKGLMILGNEGMPQYLTRRGEQLDQKVNEAYGRFDALGERVCPSMWQWTD